MNQLKKEQKYLEELKKEKTKYLVRARKGEFWIDEHKDHYYNVVCEGYMFCYRHIKNMIDIKHQPLFNRIMFHLTMFSTDLLYFFKQERINKEIIEDYWGWKKAKKEWDNMFDYTQKRIDEDYALVEKMEPYVRKIESVINEWEYKMTRRPGRVKAKKPKTGARYRKGAKSR